MSYRVCIEQPFMNCEKIFPIQQKKIKAFLEAVDKTNVRRVIVFGSSITDRCHIDSDVDVYCLLREEKKFLLKYVPYPLDMWTNFSVDDNLLKEIEKGVVVYDG